MVFLFVNPHDKKNQKLFEAIARFVKAELHVRETLFEKILFLLTEFYSLKINNFQAFHILQRLRQSTYFGVPEINGNKID
jgi:hypothetical protein